MGTNATARLAARETDGAKAVAAARALESLGLALVGASAEADRGSSVQHPTRTPVAGPV